MSDYTKDADVKQHLQEVGLVCTQWAYLEWLFEITNWWLLGLLNKHVEGRVITGSLAMEVFAKRACYLSHLKIQDAKDRDLLGKLHDRVLAILDERNLAVHGVRSWLPDDTVSGEVARGIYKNKPQNMSLIRLASLNAEIGSIISDFQPLLVRLGVLADTDI